MLAVEQTTLEGLVPEPTLDGLLVSAWHELRSRQSVECPVCCGEMEPEYAAEALEADDLDAARTGEAGYRADRQPDGGRCTDCGVVLS